MSASDSQRATIRSQTGAPPRSRSPNSYRDSTLGVFLLLLALRIANALTLRTFFQPDEFFQSLEPAWQLAFGPDANAWITWEWRTQLRSSLHPVLFATVYQVAAKLGDVCGVRLSNRADILLVAPKVAQALFAALLDYYTWKLAEKAYGRRSRTAWTTLALSICSPWQWFCSTRTLSNCIETTLTAIAVYYWPWHWPGLARDRHPRDQYKVQKKHAPESLGSLGQLRLSLLLAACACILRPTNALVWLSLSIPTCWQASNRQRYVLVRETSVCGLAVLACSVLSDRLYYQVWTFPPLRFLYFNIAQSLAVFYGKNRADYYLTEGLPLLLTTSLPFAVIGLWRSLSGRILRASPSSRNGELRILPRLAWTSLIVTLSLSLISHKEVRFLYPVLSFLHVLAAEPLSTFIPPQSPKSRKAILTLLVVVNVLIAGYASQVHQRGVIDVLSYLRHKHEAHNRLSTLAAGAGNERIEPITNTTVAFLIPCHSTPWRSHLVYPEIDAWALTCEPPLNIPLSERSTYLDEADQFYIRPGPAAWLGDNMEHVQTVTASGSRSGSHWARQDPKYKRAGRRPWPQNLVFFEQLEPVMKEVLGGTMYKECWRGFNSHFHDDRRRTGDVLVWCRE
ncbi:glycosyltransferase family 22 protein [Lentithecium fluviatile CBS 122367]|uniref:Mannosyltransferase n=1 Tax=Lentithecium fluviatile CBS 122367 TaxID=1168545 RepID=A0A6G1JKP5_9PLEO|nr:glycosyltransferase family 22 protein [Lentithecium fluviatile CBS 122367]